MGLFENGRPFRPLALRHRDPSGGGLLAEGRQTSDSQPGSAGRRRINESEAGNLIDLLVGDEDGPLSKLQEAERLQWVRDSITRLPETLRQTLILAYHQDLKYREIAEIQKIPVGTVKSRLHAALEKLQQMARTVRRGEMSDAMNADEMIDYVLGQVDGADRAAARSGAPRRRRGGRPGRASPAVDLPSA